MRRLPVRPRSRGSGMESDWVRRRSLSWRECAVLSQPLIRAAYCGASVFYYSFRSGAATRGLCASPGNALDRLHFLPAVGRQRSSGRRVGGHLFLERPVFRGSEGVRFPAAPRSARATADRAVRTGEGKPTQLGPSVKQLYDLEKSLTLTVY